MSSPSSPSSSITTTGGLADSLRARLLLMLGGMGGFHRLYLDQVPEAFIYASTAGIFMLGVFYDSFILHSLVDRYNEKQMGDEENSKKYRNGKLLPSVSKLVPFSLNHLILSILYGMWLGLLSWTAVSVTFGRTMNDSLLMLSAMAAAVTAGVYLMGNRAGQSRDLVYIWVAAFSTAFVVSRLLYASPLRVLFFSSMAATLLGNRTARLRPAHSKPFNWRHYVFWCSLFALLLCVMAVGASRHILDKRVSAAHPGESTVTSSIGSLVYDRFFQPKNVASFFKGDPKLEYKKSPSSSRVKPDSWWDLDVISRAPHWADHLAVWVVDLLRAETKVLEKTLKEEPLKWACWRMYLIVYLDTAASISDKELSRVCLKWKIERESTRRQSNMERDSDEKEGGEGFASRAVLRACDVIKG